MAKPNPMGRTFAERAAAARGDEDFTSPERDAPTSVPNSTFGSRAGRTPATPETEPEPAEEPEPEPEPAEEKTVESEDTENKAVQSGNSKSGRGGRRS